VARAIDDPSSLAPGVHLTKADWNNLPLPDESVHTIISVLGAFMGPEADEMPNVLDEITRVAADGAVLRFDGGELTVREYTGASHLSREGTLSMLRERGWSITIKHGTVIAIKKQPGANS
jgi:hypothetical protein